MIPQPIIDALGLQNHRTILDNDIFKTEVADWETEIGRVKVMDTENGYPLREGCLYFLAHGNGGCSYAVVPVEIIIDQQEWIISELKDILNK